MKFSANSLKKFIKGACYYEIKGGYVTPYKYCKNQIDLMNREGYDEFWRDRGVFTAGIRLEIKTNSDFISFDYKAYKGTCMLERSNSLDIWVDGVMFSVLRLKENRGNVFVKLPTGNKKVSVYFPNDCQFSIKNLTIEGNYNSVKEKGKRVLVIGDSITQGYGPVFSSGSYFNELQRITGYNMLNQGIGGYRCEPNDLMYVDGFEPEKIITFLGTNWYNVESYDYENATIDFYKKLTEMYPEKQILAVSPLWRGDEGLDWERFIWCREIVKRECKKHANITLIDGFTLVPNVEDCYCDKLHPNEYGCLLLAQNLHKEMKKIRF